MKKYIIVATAFAITSVVVAQKTKVQTAYSYNEAFERNEKCSELASGIEAINAAIEHEQTKDWAKTWYYRGNLYFNLLASNNQECKAIDAGALEKCADSYLKTLVLNFEDLELKKLDLQKEDGSDMMKFFGALQNNSRVDDEMYTADIMGRKLPGLASLFANEGVGNFTKKDYKAAQASFGKSMLLNQLGGKMDTTILYNTALASEYAGDNDAAKQLYDALIMLKYNVDGNGADLYRSMSKMYKKEGNKEKAMEYIKKGRAAYPNNNNLIVEELEDYLQSEKYEEALQNLNIAIVNDQKNEVLYFARGTVYENLNASTIKIGMTEKEIITILGESKDKSLPITTKYGTRIVWKYPNHNIFFDNGKVDIIEGAQDLAIADYKKALELKPSYYDAAFNLGAFYFNAGADKINESNKLALSETKKYEELKAGAKKDFEDAVPYVKKAHNLKPEDIDTGNMLIKLYTHTSQYDEAKVVKYKIEVGSLAPIGTKDETVRSIYGEPDKINRTTNENGVSEQWIYSRYKTYLYFKENKLSSIQESVE